jgi:hypothetical protein
MDVVSLPLSSSEADDALPLDAQSVEMLAYREPTVSCLMICTGLGAKLALLVLLLERGIDGDARPSLLYIGVVRLSLGVEGDGKAGVVVPEERFGVSISKGSNGSSGIERPSSSSVVEPVVPF